MQLRDTSNRFYGYEPIPALPGRYKCVGFQDRMADWFTPAMRARYPGAKITVGYKGDRPDDAGLAGPMQPVELWD